MRLAAILTFLVPLIGISQSFQLFEERHKRLVQGVSFSPDGHTIYFTLPHKEFLEAMGDSIATAPRLALYQATMEANGEWSEPELLPFSGKVIEYEPTLSPNGQLLFFNTTRSSFGQDSLDKKNNIWYVEKRGSQWSEPVDMPFLNTPNYGEDYPTITNNGWLFYVAEQESDSGFQYVIYKTKFKGKKTRRGKPIKEIPPNAGDPFVSADGRFIIYTKFDSEWVKSCDLYISHQKDGKWSAPQAIDTINTPDAPDFSPTVTPDGKWLIYRKNYLPVRVPFNH